MKFRFRVVVVVLVALIATSLAIGDEPKPPKLPKGAVAAQGDVSVTMQEIDAAAQRIPEKDRAGYFDSPKRIESTIMTLLLQKQLAEAARQDKLDRDPVVKARISNAIDDALAAAELDHHQKSLKLPDFAVLSQEFYNAHKSEFIRRGKVTVQHVLVATKSKDRSIEEAKARIGEVEAAAVAHPDQFDALVQKYSDDPSKEKNGGKIVDAGSEQMVKSFAEAAAALKTPGEISPIVRSTFGFHVLKLIDRQPDVQLAYADVQKELIEKLKKNFIDEQMNEFTGAIRGKPLEADPDMVASLRDRYAGAGFQSPQDAQDAANAARQKEQEAAPSQGH